MSSSASSSSGRRTPLAYRPDIDGLRSIAVGAVLLFHVDIALFSGGYVGVDIFFVISGFLITRLIMAEVQGGSFDFGRFYTRRARRLFPAMAATVAATLLISVLLFAPGDLDRVGGSSLSALLSFSNIFFWTEKNYFDAASALKPLLHTWSLGVEEQFYFFWPAVLVLGFRWFKWQLLFGLVVAATAVSFGLNYLFSDKASALFFLLPFRVFEFGIGAILYFWMRDRRLPRIAEEGALIAGLAMMITSCLIYTEDTPFPLVYAMLPCLGAALAIAGGQAKLTGVILTNPVATHIGKISYSLYLAHWPPIVFYKYLNGGAELTVGDQILLLVATYLLAEVMFRFVETPFRRPRSEKEQHRLTGPAFGLMAAAACVPMIIVSSSIWANDGWPWRVAKPAQAIVEQRGQVRDATMFRGQTESPAFRVLLVGDSHAGHYKPMLSDYFMVKGVQLDNLGASCAPMPGTTVMGPKGRERVCDKLGRDLRAKTPEYDGIILAGRWDTYTETDYSPRDAGRRDWRKFVTRPDETSEEFLTKEHARTVFDESLSTYIAEATGLGVPVMVMGQVPPHGSDYWRCATRPRWWSDAACTPFYTQDQSRQRIAHSENLFAQFKAAPLVSVVSIADLFCRAGEAYCDPNLGNTMVYFDDNHLTFSGARLVGPKLYDAFDEFYDDVASSAGE